MLFHTSHALYTGLKLSYMELGTAVREVVPASSRPSVYHFGTYRQEVLQVQSAVTSHT
jgi:hypothetical protein